MEEIITEVVEPNYVTVQKGTKVRKVKQYKTSDGRIFDNKEDAERHEYRLEFDKIEHVMCIDVVSELGSTWYRAKDEIELEMLKKTLVHSWANIYGLDNIKVGEWFNYRNEDGGDSRDMITFLTLPEFEKEVSDLMKSLNVIKSLKE